MAIDGIYDTGTISVNAGATAVTGVGTAWTTVGIMAGDTFEAGGLIGIIESVTDNTHLTLTRGWPGASNLSGVGYQIIEDSWLRSAISTTQRQIGRIVNILNGTGYIYPVAAGGTPDNSLGEDGQYAQDFDNGKWWKKASGVWGSPYKTNYYATGSTTANRVPKFTDANGTIGQSGVSIDSSNNVTGVTTLLATCSDLAAGAGWSNGIRVTGTLPTFWAHDDSTNSGFLLGPYNGGWFQVETGGTIGALAIALDNTTGNVGIKKSDPVCALDVDGPVRVKTYTVGTLPTASTGAGMIAYATDAKLRRCWRRVEQSSCFFGRN